jgi:hypothetical protein
LHQQLKLPRLRRIQGELGRGDEQADFPELGRADRVQCSEAGMVAIAEAGAVAFLQISMRSKMPPRT